MPRRRRAPGRRRASPRGRTAVGEQAHTYRLKRASRGLCRRSPAAGDRWHIRQPVPASRFTAVLPRGSSGDPAKPAGTGRGTGTAEGSVFGGPATSGGRPGTREDRSGRWRCRSGTRSPTARDPSASLPRPAPSRPERAWPFANPARALAGPPRTGTARAPYARAPYRSSCGEVFWRGQAFSDEPALQAGDGAVLQDQLSAVTWDLLGRPVIQR
jgi:hypothetical protein